MLFGDLADAMLETNLPCDACDKAEGIEKWTCQSCKISICPECEKGILPREQGCPICKGVLTELPYSTLYDPEVPFGFFMELILEAGCREGFESLREKYFERRGFTRYEKMWKEGKKLYTD